MGYNIEEIRTRKNMSQEELAKKANVSRSIISGLESGRVTQTTVKTLEKIADALGVDISYFSPKMLNILIAWEYKEETSCRWYWQGRANR